MTAEEFNRIQVDILRARAQSAERVGWFSGATISLSFTLLGYLLSKNYLILLLQKNNILLWLLMWGWIFLGISVVGSLLIRVIGEKWLYDASSYLYLTHNPDGFAQAINNSDPNLAALLLRRANLKSSLHGWIELLVYISAVIGIIFAIGFLTILISTLFN
jgi:hypothetical protein